MKYIEENFRDENNINNNINYIIRNAKNKFELAIEYYHEIANLENELQMNLGATNIKNKKGEENINKQNNKSKQEIESLKTELEQAKEKLDKTENEKKLKNYQLEEKIKENIKIINEKEETKKEAQKEINTQIKNTVTINQIGEINRYPDAMEIDGMECE